MCAKQCRDANGFKCHQTSASHLKMMSILRDSGQKVVDDFSVEFEESYVETLRRRHGVKRVNANNVYQEVIADKHHIHMNATQWETLTSFVQYLGKKGSVIVEEDERGWFVQYIDRSEGTIKKKAALEERMRAEKEEEEKERRKLERRIREAAKMGDAEVKEATGIDKGKKVESVKVGGAGGGVKRKLLDGGFKMGGGEEKKSKPSLSGGAGGSNSAKPMSALDRIMEENRAKKEKEEETKRAKEAKREEEEERRIRREKREKKGKKKDYWLRKGIVVKVINKKLEGGKFYKAKGVVREVVDKYAGRVEIMGEGEKEESIEVILDQDDLETVVPKVGKEVVVVNGYGRGETAVVKEILEKEFKARLVLVEDGEVVDVDYEGFSTKF